MNAISLPTRARRWFGSDTPTGSRSRIDPELELERLSLLAAELQHRLSNTLQVVQAIAHRSARDCGSVDEFLSSFEDRLAVLARVQSAMIRSDEAAVALYNLVTSELAAVGVDEEAGDRVSVAGSGLLFLAPRTAEIVALGIHELAVNSRKYGVLSGPAGDIRISWDWSQRGGKRSLWLEWHEVGSASRAKAVRRTGFGSELILRALPRQLGTETRYSIDDRGVHCAIEIPAEFAIEEQPIRG